MKLQVKEQIKSLLAQRNVKLKDLARLLTEKTDRNYSLSGLSHRLKLGTVSYNEVLAICEILDYEIQFIDKK